MSQAPVSASGLVRVTVSSGTRRVDLVLPGSVPVAELVPELARSVGLLDAATVYGGYRVVTADGRELAGESGLTTQGIEDGGLLTVTAGVDEAPPRIYDDVVEAMTDVVERDLEPWAPASGRRTALVAAGLLMTLGAVALLIQYESLLAGRGRGRGRGGAGGRRDRAVPGPARARGGGRRGLDGLRLRRPGRADARAAPGRRLLRLPGGLRRGGCAGGRADLRGRPRRGAHAGAAAGRGRGDLPGHRAAHHRPAPSTRPWCSTTALAIVVLAGSVFPWLALGVTGTKVDQLFAPADITADPAEIDPERVGADARVAHQILVAVSATVGLLLVLVAPLAVSLGLSGTLLAVVACLVVMLRTRQYRTGQEVLVGLGSGILGLASVAVSLLWMHPDWRPTVAVTLAATGAVLLAVTLIPGTPSLRRGRLG